MAIPDLDAEYLFELERKYEYNVLVGGRGMYTHKLRDCRGEFCTIHRNSPHHMVKWPQNWRDDRYIMERICPHEIGHPDPDDPKTQDPSEAVHGCDGCCDPQLQFESDVKDLTTNYEEK